MFLTSCEDGIELDIAFDESIEKEFIIPAQADTSVAGTENFDLAGANTELNDNLENIKELEITSLKLTTEILEGPDAGTSCEMAFSGDIKINDNPFVYGDSGYSTLANFVATSPVDLALAGEGLGNAILAALKAGDLVSLNYLAGFKNTGEQYKVKVTVQMNGKAVGEL